MKASDNPLPSQLYVETVDPAAPAAGHKRLFIDTDHKLKTIDSSSTVVDYTPGAGGDVATDAIWDAAGDLAVGTGANTAGKLTKGATGTVPTAGASTLAYAYPPGHEFDYAEKTSNTNITATTEGTADTIITGNAVAYDGSTVVMIETFFVYLQAPSADSNIVLVLYDGAASIGFMMMQTAPTATGYSGNFRVFAHAARRITPSNASHTYSIRGYTSGGTGVAAAGAGGSGAFMPAFIRITKV